MRGNPASKLIPWRLIAVLGCCLFVGTLTAGPKGGVVVDGRGTIKKPDSKTTKIRQRSSSMVIDWDSFNLGADEKVKFRQPSRKSAVLNRIGDQNPSQIHGSISANGRVFLSNPNGLFFGPSAQVNVGALVATSLRISPSDFMRGKYRLEPGNGGAVINQGILEAANGGGIALIGNNVRNEGIILANYGHVVLATGRQAVINFDGDGLLNFRIDEAVLQNTTGAEDAIHNSGSIIADAGQILLSAHASADIFDNVINNEGLLRATRIENRGGVIHLSGPGGRVISSGDIEATGIAGAGGEVHLLGNQVGLFDDASIDVSGSDGGGVVLIGGDFQGSNPDITNAEQTYVAEDVSIRADALVAGDGGKIIVWADDWTRFHGDISARGGSLFGDGGFVEVSGKQNLGFVGSVDTGADNGAAGMLLLDPSTLYVGVSDPGNGASPDTSDPFGVTTGDVDFYVLQSSLGDNSYTLQASQDIIFYENVVFGATAGKTVTVTADRHISAFESGTDYFTIGTSGGNLSMTAGAGTDGAGTGSAGGEIDVGAINTMGGDLTLLANLGDGSATNAGKLHAGDITTAGIDGEDPTRGGIVQITAEGSDTATSTSLEVGNIDSTGGDDDMGNGGAKNGGAVTIRGTGGKVVIGGIDTSGGSKLVVENGTGGNGGNIILESTGNFDFTVGDIDANGGASMKNGQNAGNAGSIMLTQNGNETFSVGAVSGVGGTDTKGDGGTGSGVTIIANGATTIASIDSSGGTTTQGGRNGGAAGAVMLTQSGNATFTVTNGIQGSGGVGGGSNGAGSAVTVVNATGGGTFVLGGTTTNAASIDVDGTSSLTGTITTTGTQEYTGAVTLVSGATDVVEISTTTVTFSDTVQATADGVQSLNVSTGNSVFADDVGGQDAGMNDKRLDQLTVAGTTTLGNALAATTVTTTGKQTYNGAVTLAGDTTTESTGGGDITFAMAIDGASVGSLAINTAGVSQIQAGATNLTGLSTNAGGTTELAGTIGSTGAQSYGDAVMLTGVTATTSSAGSVTFDAAISGNEDLTISGTSVTAQTITTSDVAGPAPTAGGAVSITASGGVLSVGAIDTTGGSNNTDGAGADGGDVTVSGDTGAMTLAGITTDGGAAAGAGANNGGAAGTIDITQSAAATVSVGDISAVGGVASGGGTDGDGAAIDIINGVAGATFTLTGTSVAGASITVDGGSSLQGTITTTGAQIYTGAVTLADNVDVSTPGLVSFNNTVDADAATESLTVSDAAGSVLFADDVGATTELSSLTVAGTATLGNGSDLTTVKTTGAQIYRKAVTLAGDVTLEGTAGSAQVTFDSTVTGGGGDRNLTLDFAGDTSIVSGTFFNIAALTSTGGGTTFLSGMIDTSGAQTYDDAVFLTADVDVSTPGLVSFNNTVDADAATESLTVSDAAGSVLFADDVGATTELSSLTVAGTATLGNGSDLTTVKTTGAQIYRKAVTLAGDTTTESTGGGDITFVMAIDGASVGSLAINTAGVSQIQAGATNLTGLSTNAGGTTELAGTIGSTGAQSYGDAVMLTGVTATTSSAGSVTFDAAISGNEDLTISGTSVTAQTITTSDVAGPAPTAGGAVSITASGGVLSVGAIDTTGGSNNTDGAGADGGDVTVSGDTGAMTLAGITTDGGAAAGAGANNGGAAGTIDITQSAAATVSVGDISAVGGVASGGGTDGDGAAIDIINGVAGATFTLTGTSVAGASITVDGDSSLQGTITTTGAQIYTGAVTLADNVDVSTPGLVSFNNTVDADAATESLTVSDAAGSVLFADDVGATTELSSLTVAGTATLGNGSDLTTVKTTGAQIYRKAVTLAGDVTLEGTAGSAQVTFDSTVTGGGGDRNLTLDFAGDTSIVSGTFFNIAALTSTGGGTTFLSGMIDTSGAQTYDDAVFLTADVDVSTPGLVSFNNTVDADAATESLTVSDAAGSVLFADDVGATTELSSLTVAGTATLGNGSDLTTVKTTGAQSYNKAVTFAGDTVALSNTNSVTFDEAITGNADLTISGTSVTAQAITTSGVDGPAPTAGGAVSITASGGVLSVGAIDTTGGSNNTDGAGADGGDVTVSGDTGAMTLAGITTDGGAAAGAGANNGGAAGTIDITQSAAATVSVGDISAVGGVASGGGTDGDGAAIDIINGVAGATFTLTGTSVAGASITVAEDSSLQGTITTTGAQTYTGAMALVGDTTLVGSTPNFNGVSGGTNSLELTFSDAIDIDGSRYTDIVDLESNGTGGTNLSGTIDTSGTQTYSNDVTLAGDVTLDMDTGLDVTFNGNVNSADGMQFLAVSSGDAVFANEVGDTQSLASLSVAGTTSLGGNVTTLGTQIYNDAVTLTGDVDVSATSTTFGSTVQAATNGGQSLDVVSGNALFSGAVGGGGQALSGLTVTGTTSLGGNVTTTGAQTYTGAVTLTSDVTSATGAGQDVTFGSTVDSTDSTQFLAVAVGDAVFGGDVGGTQSLERLSVDGTTSLGGDVTTTGTQTYTGAVTLASDVTSTTGAGQNVTFSSTVNSTNSNQFLAVAVGDAVFADDVGGTQSLESLSVDGTTSLAGEVTTTGDQTYTGQVTLTGDTSLTGTTPTFGNGVDGGAHDLELTFSGTTEIDTNFVNLANLTANGGGTTNLTGGLANANVTGELIVVAGKISIENDLNLDDIITLRSTSDGDIRMIGDVGLTAGGLISLDVGGVLRGDGDITFNSEVSFSPNMLVRANKGTLTLNKAGSTGDLTLEAKNIDIDGKLDTGKLKFDAKKKLDINAEVVSSGDISIKAADLVIDDTNGSISSSSEVMIADQGKGIGIAGGTLDFVLDTTEIESIDANHLVLRSNKRIKLFNDLNLSSFSGLLEIDTPTFDIVGAGFGGKRIISLGGGLDLGKSDATVEAPSGSTTGGELRIETRGDFDMGANSSITNTGSPITITTKAGGSAFLGLLDATGSTVNIKSDGDILNGFPAVSNIKLSEANVIADLVTLNAKSRIGASSTDAVTLDIDPSGKIDLTFGSEFAYINNLNATDIVNNSSGEVLVGLIFSSQVIGIGHNVGLDSTQTLNPLDQGVYDDIVAGVTPIKVLGSDFQVYFDEDEADEIVSTIIPSVPVLVRTLEGWEFVAPSRRQTLDKLRNNQRNGEHFIDWL